MPIALNAVRAALGEIDHSAEDDAYQRGKATAARLCGVIEANRAESEIAEIHNWAFNIELVLKNGDQWSIECLSPAAFRMYPGGANIWVRETDMDVDELVKDINEVAFRGVKGRV
jgi:hypothetical protein